MTKECKKDCKKNCANCDDCANNARRAFELEVDEELRQDRLNAFWAKYRALIYGTVIGVLALTAGIQLYQSWQMKVRLAESDMFEKAVTQIFIQEPDKARPQLIELATNGRTGYKYLARLELAGLAARQNDIETALAEFATLMESDAPESLRDVATLSYVGHQVDDGEPKTLLQKLEPMLNNPNYIGISAELATVLYIRDGQPEKAKEILNKALLMPEISDVVKTRLQALLQMVEG